MQGVFEEEQQVEEVVGEIEEEKLLLDVQNLRSLCSGFRVAGLLWALEALQAANEPPLFLVYPLKPVHQFAPAGKVGK